LNKSNVIEIRGIDFVNKGAELMLIAIQQTLSHWEPRPIATAQLRIGNSSLRAQRGLGHLLRIDLNAKGVRSLNPLIVPLSAAVGNLLPGPLCAKASLYREKDVTAVIDASGFSYGDQLGVHSSALMAYLSGRWKRHGKTVILLPQAVGPFTKPAVREAFGEVLRNADLVYVRDKTSLSNLEAAFGQRHNVRRAPDITVAVTPEPHSDRENLCNVAAIIPSQRMLDKTDRVTGQNYLELLAGVVAHLAQRGIESKIVVHETKDIAIATSLHRLAKNASKLVIEPDPIEIKRFLGSVELVVSSRFHGLVSALSQGVPVLAMGWSHKYRELLEDYHCTEYLIEQSMPLDDVLCHVDRLIEAARSEYVRDKLRETASEQRDLVHHMWTEIRSLLTKST
jgi:polysaccharide pyruvyl transferase WcaK-like protein